MAFDISIQTTLTNFGFMAATEDMRVPVELAMAAQLTFPTSGMRIDFETDGFKLFKLSCN